MDALPEDEEGDSQSSSITATRPKSAMIKLKKLDEKNRGKPGEAQLR